jgi:hypothetical protein
MDTAFHQVICRTRCMELNLLVENSTNVHVLMSQRNYEQTYLKAVLIGHWQWADCLDSHRSSTPNINIWSRWNPFWAIRAIRQSSPNPGGPQIHTIVLRAGVRTADESLLTCSVGSGIQESNMDVWNLLRELTPSNRAVTAGPLPVSYLLDMYSWFILSSMYVPKSLLLSGPLPLVPWLDPDRERSFRVIRSFLFLRAAAIIPKKGITPDPPPIMIRVGRYGSLRQLLTGL